MTDGRSDRQTDTRPHHISRGKKYPLRVLVYSSNNITDVSPLLCCTLRVVDNAIFIAIKFSSTKILITLSIFMFSLFVLCYYCKSEIDKDKLIYYRLERFFY